jgi:arginase
VPLALGGDSLHRHRLDRGQAIHHRRAGLPVGLIWVDAHADMNTPESSPSGNIHGMPLAVCLGKGPPELTGLAGGPAALDARHVSIVGARDLDGEEREIVRRSGVRCYTMSEIDERGIAVCLDEAIARATEGTAGIHLSFDLDGRSRNTPGVGTGGGQAPPRGAPRVREVARTGRLLGMDLVELNPILDEGNPGRPASALSSYCRVWEDDPLRSGPATVRGPVRAAGGASRPALARLLLSPDSSSREARRQVC